MRSGRVALLCLACTLLAAHRSAAADAFFDYLYIEASSGSSAGGHAAVRFAEEVYHFQHADPGIIRPAVEPWTSFDLSYRGLENRPIHVQRIAVSPAAYERLRAGFHRRYVVQESHVHLLDNLRRERELLACLAESGQNRPAACQIRLPGAGYFFASPQDASEDWEGARSPAPSSLGAVAIEEARRNVERAYGAAYSGQRVDDLRSAIENLHPAGVEIQLPSAGVVSVPPLLFAEEYRNLLLELLALQVLAGQATANAQAFRVWPGLLTAAQRAAVRRREARTQETVIALLRSSRPDRGYPLLVALARLVAFRASRRNGKLVVVDTYADDVPTTGLASVRQLPALLEIQFERRQEAQSALETALAASPGDEASWSRFEAAANVALELDGALANDRPLRSHQPSLAPARGAQARAEWPVPRLSETTAATAVDRATGQERQVKRSLRGLYRYDLVGRNCVTEIFRAIDDADLGYRVVVTGNANFIPFVSAAAVQRSYPVVERFVLPSYRQQRLYQLRTAPGRWRTLLREGTSLTSRLVPFNAGDEAFLFFSSETVLLRPLLGTANVAFGSAAILAGALIAPFDQGTLLAAGARGVFYSLPEVVFVNIRKGTVPLLPSDWDAAPLAGAP